ncbi:MAG: Gfo/Idh/MocA family oxidoreductase [Candidatus Methanoperedens sp.]|nr:Gfo/Idh/MocA family oxidoreductase [Candidatus Methanoperedens sp.]
MQVGIIGAGIQAKSAHLPAFNSMPNIVISGIADININAAKELAKKFKIPNVYSKYQDLLDNPDIDLISICTPHNLHKTMAIDCALAGKHVLIEKPMSTNVEDADEIIRTVSEMGVKLCIVQNYRLFKCVQEAKEKIGKGKIGNIISLNGHAHVFKSFGSRSSDWLIHENSAGLIEDFGPHLIDIILYLNNFNKISRIFAIGGNLGGYIDLIMTAQILIEFENGSTAILDISGLGGTKEIAGYIEGTGGLIHLDIRNDQLQEIHQYSTPLDDISFISTKLNKIFKGILDGSYFHGAKSNYVELITEFIKSIENNTKSPISAEEGRMIALVIESAYKSIKEKRPIIIQ